MPRARRSPSWRRRLPPSSVRFAGNQGALPLVGCSSDGTAIPCEGEDESPNDNNACTVANCDDGFCTYDPIECDADVSDCTVEMCDPAVGSEQSPVADGTRCAGGTCQAGVCELGGSVLPCSEQGIRNALAAGGAEVYTFDCDGTTPVATEGVIVVDNDVILDGEGNLTVTDGGFNPIVVVEEEVTAELRGFTMIGGAPLLVPSEKIGMLPPGSGILNYGTLTNSTVSGNMANEPENELRAIVNGENATLTVANNLIDGGCGNDGVLTSNGYNIESPGNTCGFDQTGDRSGVTAEELNLGPLADNGGPTQTHALLTDPVVSMAINRIPQADCQVTEDQREEPRPETGGTMCDVGSFEVQLAP